ncbi:MAG: hypothetical protein IE889_01550 [Campylobacterales bacterium]|nr:hypothetical protein [Campylobacterales bacterium]
MLEELFGSKNRERVLQYIFTNGEGYAKEIADFALVPNVLVGNAYGCLNRLKNFFRLDKLRYAFPSWSLGTRVACVFGKAS